MAKKRNAENGALVESLAQTALVTFEHGQARTTSLIVAERFGKRHDNVVRDIRRLIEDCPDPEFHLLNFEEMFYFDEAGQGAKRKQPMYRLTKDGFMLLAMGFTGDEALRWKIGFIKAFNAMEQALRDPRIPARGAVQPDSLHDQVFATFLDITRGRIHHNADGTTHDTVSINTAKILQWLWRECPPVGWRVVGRREIGRAVGIEHTTVRRTMQRLAKWGFLEERMQDLHRQLECRLHRDAIQREMLALDPLSRVALSDRVQ